MTLERGTRSVEDGSLRTIECLRGRLVAERQASRASEENAEFMANKLKELEEKLKEETKLRDKATKKLKSLERKLKSMKNSIRLKGAEESSVSESSIVSCESSTVPTVNSRTKPEQDQEQTHETSFDSECDVSKGTEPKRIHDISCTADGFSSSWKHCPNLERCKSTEQHSVIVTVMENEEDYEGHVDNSLALVPITVPEESQIKELKIISRSVSEVLETLRNAREGIQRTMRRNSMMKLRPPQAQIC